MSPSSSPPAIVEKRKRQHELETPLQAKRKVLYKEDKDPARVGFSTFALHSLDPPSLKAPIRNRIPPRSQGPFHDDDDDDDDTDTANTGSMLNSLESENPRTTNKTSRVESFPANKDSSTQKHVLYRASTARTSSGKNYEILVKKEVVPMPYGKIIAERSTTAHGKATRSYYGIDIHKLLNEATECVSSETRANSDDQRPPMKAQMASNFSKKNRTMLWMEKYRARKFTDLVGDERTHRDVLRWLKGWDSIVFPGISRLQTKSKLMETEIERRQQRKILVLTGPPGLGKTTLAHVCARQAGYEVVEINASDERSRDVVKGRIKDCVGTENVKGVNVKDAAGTTRKAGKPVCVIIDEVDGVVSGSSGGVESGFIKALIDLVTLDEKNSNVLGSTSANLIRSKKKGDRFRLLRPMILICNDIYHPALRHLRASTTAEIVHIRRPPLDKVVARLKSVFIKEGIACNDDGVRRLCQVIWGISDKRESQTTSSGASEGDMRGIMVVSEWAAAKMRASTGNMARLTKEWVDGHMLANLSSEEGGSRGLGRGGAKEIVERVFSDGAGFPKAAFAMPNQTGKVQDGDFLGVSELAKYTAMTRLRDVIDTCGESDRIVVDCFTAYLLRTFQDDTFLTKPNAAHEWLHFHDQLSSKIYGGHEWELEPYLSQSVLGFHHLFASSVKHSWADQKRWGDDDEEPLPFSGPRADYLASDALKQNKVILLSLQSSLSSQMLRSFRSTEDISTDLLPSLVRMLTPDVKPVVIGGSGDQRGVVSVRKEKEREMIHRAVGVMAAVGVTLERARVDMGQSGISSHIYRMEP